MVGRINSIQSLGTVDGPGVRAVVFASGCPLRCAYCHNPDTWRTEDGQVTEVDDLAKKILRLRPYIQNGGVTFSGGEPCLQPEFFAALAEKLQAQELHIALDTSGCIINEHVIRLLKFINLLLLDIKFTSDDDYKRYTGGSLTQTLEFLALAEKMNVTVWVRHVVIPGINDTKEDILRLKDIMGGYSCIKKCELLPFKKICVPKYENLGIKFPLRDTPACDEKTIERLYSLIDEYRT